MKTITISYDDAIDIIKKYFNFSDNIIINIGHKSNKSNLKIRTLKFK